jgi:DNA-binding protein YbaB
MMDKIKMMTDAYNLRKAIEAEVVEIEENGIKIVIGGDLKIKQISLKNSEDNILKDVINKAIRNAQEMMVLKMKEMINLKNLSQENQENT